jgi:hypothetical protein
MVVHPNYMQNTAKHNMGVLLLLSPICAHLHHSLRHAGAAVRVPEVLQQPAGQLRAQQHSGLTQQQLPVQ